jgi:hypothetical protein
MDDPNSAISKLFAKGNTEVLHSEFGLKEKVSYLGLPKKFVAGTIVYGDKQECATGVEVVLRYEGETKNTMTDGFGDFEFEGLPANKEYTVKIAVDDYAPQERKVMTKVDVYLGEIEL